MFSVYLYGILGFGTGASLADPKSLHTESILLLLGFHLLAIILVPVLSWGARKNGGKLLGLSAKGYLVAPPAAYFVLGVISFTVIKVLG
jgi:hypothetical protein